MLKSAGWMWEGHVLLLLERETLEVLLKPLYISNGQSEMFCWSSSAILTRATRLSNSGLSPTWRLDLHSLFCQTVLEGKSSPQVEGDRGGRICHAILYNKLARMGFHWDFDWRFNDDWFSSVSMYRKRCIVCSLGRENFCVQMLNLLALIGEGSCPWYLEEFWIEISSMLDFSEMLW